MFEVLLPFLRVTCVPLNACFNQTHVFCTWSFGWC